MKGLVFVFIACTIMSATCHAESLCPWINKATALGTLGTSEEAAPANLSEITNTTCGFTYRYGDVTRELRITVEQANDWARVLDGYKSRCGHDMSPLRAMGNEAVMCAANQKGQGELIVGRVRDNIFTISLSTSSTHDSSMSREALIQKITLVAEQVSGNLF